jgi:tRNA threonylcarbamoyl adenosine modification protein (Sua5/YciO/YrdC/YwlC family)
MLHYHLHHDHPAPFDLTRIAEALEAGGLMLYPTDTVYALGCLPSRKDPLDRLRAVKGDTGRNIHKPVTLLCPSLTDIATFAHVGDADYKLMRALTPGPFTFILRATREVPRLVLNPRRKTIGLRVPDHRLCQALMTRLSDRRSAQSPDGASGLLISTSARLPDGVEADSLDELIETFAPYVDLVVTTDQPFQNTPSTVLDLTTPGHTIVREGRGMDRLSPFQVG